jgi:diacylglycerol O-acyltransferase / wax synthase
MVGTSERMTGADAAWLRMDRPGNPMVVNTLVELDGPVRWDDVEAAFTERVVRRFPRFRQRAVDPPAVLRPLAPARWVADDGFRLGRHVHRSALRGADLHDHLGPLVSRTLPDDRPLWELHLVESTDGGGAVLLRSHHAIADGTALVHVWETATDPAGDAAPSGGTRRDTAGAPDPLGLEALAARADTLTRLSVPPSPVPAVSGTLQGAKGVARSLAVPVASVKDAGRRCGATVNDVLLAVVAGGLRRYLERHGRSPVEAEVVVPFNVRRPDEPLDQLGNRFGLVFVRLPVDAPEPDVRIRRTKQEMDRVKASGEGSLVSGGLTVLGHAAGPFDQRWVDLLTRRASAVVTNIAGPRRARTLAGAPVRSMALWVPTSGSVGLGLSFFSYDGDVSIGVIADVGVVPDHGALLADLEGELGAVCAAGGAPA